MVEPSDYIIVTEAIFDSMTLGSQSVASGGAILTDDQVRKIRALNPVNGVILAPDNDDAGKKSMVSNYRLLQPYFKKIFYALPPKLKYGNSKHTKDWNDLGQKKLVKWGKIRGMFEERIKPLTRELIVQFMVSSN